MTAQQKIMIKKNLDCFMGGERVLSFPFHSVET